MGIFDDDPTDAYVTPKSVGYQQPRQLAQVEEPAYRTLQRKQEIENEGVTLGGAFQTVAAPLVKVGNAIDALDFGQSIKGGLEAYGRTGDLGEAASAAFANNPLFQIIDYVSDLVGNPTHLTHHVDPIDIEKAFGKTDAEEGGVANFFTTLGISIATDPIGMMLVPFGRVGMAAKLGETSVASIAKAVTIGERAMATLHVPFTDIAVGFNPFGTGISTNIGKALDATFGFLRTNKVTGSMLRLVSDRFPNVAGAEEARAITKIGQLTPTMGNAYQQALVKMLASGQMSADTLKWISSQKDIHGAISAALDSGFGVMDDIGTITNIVRDPASFAAKNRLVRLLSSTEEGGSNEFKALWRESQLDPNAAKALYDSGYNVPMGPQIEKFGEKFLPPRPGIEIPRSQRLTPAETLLTGGEKVPGETLRAGTQGGARVDYDSILADAQDNVIEQFKAIQAMPEARRDQLVNFVNTYRSFAQNRAKALSLAGLLNKGFEYAAGPYFARFVTPEAKEIINRQFETGFSKLPNGGQVMSSFMQGRKFTDLNTIESNAVMQYIGSRITDFKPLGKLKELTDTHGMVDGITGWIFDKPFLRKYAKVDEEGAAFFNTNPVNSLFQYQEATSRALTKAGTHVAMVKGLATDSAPIADVETLAKWGQDPNSVIVVLHDAPTRPGKLSSVISNDDAIMGGAIHDAQSAAKAHMAKVDEGFYATLAEGKASYTGTVDELRPALSINERTLPESLAVKDTDSWAVRTAKEVGREIRDNKESETALSELGRLHQLETKGTAGQALKRQELKQTKDAFSGVTETTGRQMLPDSAIVQNQGLRDKYEGILAKYETTGKATNVQAKADFALEVESLKADAERLKSVKLDAGGGIPEPNQYGTIEGERQAIQQRIAARREYIDVLRDRIDQTKDVNSYVAAHIAQEKQAIVDARPRLYAHQAGVYDAVREKLGEAQDVWAQARGAAQAERSGQRTLAQAASRVGPQNVDPVLRNIHLNGYHGSITMEQATQTVLDPATGETLAGAMAKNSPNSMAYRLQRDTYEAAQAHMADMFRPDFLRNAPVVPLLDAFSKRWKPYVSINPLFPQSRFKDWLSGTLTIGAGGQNPLSAITEGPGLGRLFTRHMQGDAEATAELLSRQIDLGGGRTMGALDLVDHAQRQTGYGLGMMQDAAIDTAREAITTKGGTGSQGLLKEVASAIVPITPGSESAVMRFGARNAAFVDDTVRMNAFLGGLRRGMSPEQAGAFARQWTYNPAINNTSFERSVLKRVIPFGQYATWAAGRMADTALENPAVLKMFQKVQDASYSNPIAGGPAISPAEIATILPRYIQEGMGIPFRNGPDGPSFFTLGSYLPIGEVSQMAAGIRGLIPGAGGQASDALDYIGSKLHPLIKSAAEVAIKRDFFAGQALEPFDGAHTEWMGITLDRPMASLVRNLRFLTEIDRLKLFRKDQSDAILGAQQDSEKPMFGKKFDAPPLERFLTSGFGILPKSYGQDVAQKVGTARIEKQETINELRGRYRLALVGQSQGNTVSEEDAKTLREQLGQRNAELSVITDLEKRYGVDEKRRRQIRGQQTQQALALLKEQ